MPIKKSDLGRAAADLYLQVLEARRSPLGLFKLIATSEEGEPAYVKWFHAEWFEMMEKHKDVIIVAPRESGKTLVMVFVVLWLIGKNPNIRIKWLGENEPLAIKRLAMMHEIIDKSTLYHMVFPHIHKTKRGDKRPNNATQLNVERSFSSTEPTVEANGILGAGTGGRADVIVADDIVGASNALTNPALKPKVIEKFLGDWLAMLTSKGRVLYIGTPWATDDCLAYVKKHMTDWANKKYKHGRRGDPYYSIFPERWPREILIQRRRHWGAIHYARAYLCEPLGETVITIDPENLRPYGMTHLTDEKLGTAVAVLSLDPASGKEAHKGKLDFFGVTVGLLSPRDAYPGFELFIPDVYQVRIPLGTQAKLAWQLCREWEASYMLIEAKGMQSLDAWLTLEQQRLVTLPPTQIMPITFGSLSKGQRLTQAAPIMDPPEHDPPIVWFHPNAIAENPQADFITIDGVNYEVTRELREQMLSFPTTHDDALDSCTQLLNWVRMHYADGTIDTAARGNMPEGASVSVISL
jgi:hypothetical protein